MHGRYYFGVAALAALAILPPMRAAGEALPETANRAKGMALQITIVLHEEADRMEREGRPSGSLAKSLAEKAGLDEAQTAALRAVALRLSSQVAPLDERARQLIQESRRKYPDGRLPAGVAPPPPPPELAVLQSRRDAAVAQAVAELDRDLGPTGATKLVDYMAKAEKTNSLFSVPVRAPSQIGLPGNPVRPGISQQSTSPAEVKR